MKAAVLFKANEPLQVVDCEHDPPKALEVRVRMQAAGVCQSDWHVMNGDWPLAAADGARPRGRRRGRRDAVPASPTVKPGDHVIFSFRPHCGHCRYCASGRTVLCIGRDSVPRWLACYDGTLRVKLNGEPASTRWRASAPSREVVVCPAERWCRSARTCRGRRPPSSAAAWRPASAPSPPRQGRGGLVGAGDRLRRRRPQRGAGRHAVGRRPIIAADLLDNKLGYGEGASAPPTPSTPRRKTR